MESKILLQGDIKSVTEKSAICNPPSTKVRNFTIQAPEPDFEQIKDLISDKPLRFVKRRPLSN